MLTLNDYLTSSGKHPDRVFSKEASALVFARAEDLGKRINGLLTDIGISAKYSSGFRPSEVNAATKYASKKSNHLTGNAGDLKGHEVANVIMNDLNLLIKHDLYMEHPDCTVLRFNGGEARWTHLQRVAPGSKKRVFRCGICETCKAGKKK